MMETDRFLPGADSSEDADKTDSCCANLWGCACCCWQSKQPRQCGCVTSWVLAVNTAAVVAHFVTFVTLLGFVLAWELVKTQDLTETIVVWQERNASCKTYEPVQDDSVCADGRVCVDTASTSYEIYSARKENGALSLELLVLSFSALSFLFQGVRPCVRFDSPQGRLTYLEEVSHRVQRLRWVEYSVSATTMILALSMVVNKNLAYSTAVLVGTSTAATQFCGLVAEFLLEAVPVEKDDKTIVLGRNTDKSKWLLAFVIHAAGWVLQMGVFTSVYAAYFLSADVAASDGNPDTEGPPAWVTGAIVGTAILFGSFGVVQLVDLCDRTYANGCCTCFVPDNEAEDPKKKKYKCTRCLRTQLCCCFQPHCSDNPGAAFELVYVLLSLTAKLFLSILVASNLFLPN